MRNKTIIGLTLIASALMLMPKDADARYYYRQRSFGFRHQPHAYFGGQLMGAAVVNQATDNPNAPFDVGAVGGGLYGGFRVNPFLSIELDWWITYNSANSDWYADTLWLTAVELAAKIHIPTRGPLEPYFQVGGGYSWNGVSYPVGRYDSESSILTTGPTFNVGGGLDFYLGPHFSLGGRVLYRGVYLGTPDFTDNNLRGYDNYMSMITVDINATIHF